MRHHSGKNPGFFPGQILKTYGQVLKNWGKRQITNYFHIKQA
ncbi:Uncharacterized protein dnm_012800 [Desulfonema magnum]|uniref:Uncharacterized protein n=1 Tax=Desulfonema magnum TaxID=45655 RepID=A0A975GL73_9BACT|nr:Uncharacterized protein dnm_012800 [Desulfonema magnum]